MAVYRLHRKIWEKGIKPGHEHASTKKRKRLSGAGEDGGEHGRMGNPPRGGRIGVSSGLSTIVSRSGMSGSGEKTKWWKELGGKSANSKGSMRFRAA
jgi:RNA exonuclease 4